MDWPNNFERAEDDYNKQYNPYCSECEACREDFCICEGEEDGNE